MVAMIEDVAALDAVEAIVAVEGIAFSRTFLVGFAMEGSPLMGLFTTPS